MLRTRLLSIALVCMLAVLCAGCQDQNPSAAAETDYPFELANFRVDGRRAEMDVVRRPDAPVENAEQVSLLLVFSVNENPDLLGLGTRARKGIGQRDDEFGGWVVFATLIGSDVTDYRGAWWLGRPDAPEEWIKKDHIALQLPQVKNAGKIVGEGTFTALLVRGAPGRGNFEALSKPVTLHRPAEETNSAPAADQEASASHP